MSQQDRNYVIVSRYMEAGHGWKRKEIKIFGSYEYANLVASEQAHKLDSEFSDSHFWTVDLYNPESLELGSYYQLFHGRLN